MSSPITTDYEKTKEAEGEEEQKGATTIRNKENEMRESDKEERKEKRN